MDVSWLGDWSFWAWAIPLAVTIAFGGFQVGVWWSGRDRAKVVEAREDREYVKRNSAVLRVTPALRSGHGDLHLHIENTGDHRATSVHGLLQIGELQRSFGHQSWTLSPHVTVVQQFFMGLDDDREPKFGGYPVKDLGHLLSGGTLNVSFTDGLGEHHRSWKITFQPQGERFDQWNIALEPLEE